MNILSNTFTYIVFHYHPKDQYTTEPISCQPFFYASYSVLNESPGEAESSRVSDG